MGNICYGLILKHNLFRNVWFIVKMFGFLTAPSPARLKLVEVQTELKVLHWVVSAWPQYTIEYFPTWEVLNSFFFRNPWLKRNGPVYESV